MDNFHLGLQPQRLWHTMTYEGEEHVWTSCRSLIQSLEFFDSLAVIKQAVFAQSRTLQQQLSLSPQGSRWRGGAFQHCPRTPFSGCFQLAVPASVCVCVCIGACITLPTQFLCRDFFLEHACFEAAPAVH